MGYDINYVDEDGNNYKLKEHHKAGGNISSVPETSISITYNYAKHYYAFLDAEEGIRWLYGRKGKDCVKRLKEATKLFEHLEPSDNYWENTIGNCNHVLKVLLSWCEEFPEGVFEGD